MNTRGIQDQIRQLQADLVQHGPALGRAIPNVRRRLLPLLNVYSSPFLARKLRTDAAFVVRGRQLIFNVSGIQLFHAQIDAAVGAGRLAPDLADIARQMATEQVAVHELDHVTTGLIRFSDVQHLKKMAGVNVLGEMDLAADARTAQLCARLEMVRAQERGSLAYSWRLLQQLMLMGSFAFPAFGAPADKPHKQQRFLGLAMMAARVDGYRCNGCRLAENELPIDTPLYPHVDPTGRLLLSAFHPDRILLGQAVAVDPKLLQQTCNDLDRVPFQRSVARAGLLLKQVGPLAGPVADRMVG